MTEEAKETGSLRFANILAGTGFDDMQYWIWIAKEKFHSGKFSEAIGSSSSLTASPEDPQRGEFHVKASWGLDEDNEMGFAIGYSAGPGKRRKNEHGPYAEQFMEWLGQFFKYESAEAHIHASFNYPIASRTSKFPLPLKMPIEGKAEIDGISVKLPSAPHGVSSIRLLRGSRDWSVEIIANRRIVFREHSVYHDVQEFVSVIDILLEEKRQ